MIDFAADLAAILGDTLAQDATLTRFDTLVETEIRVLPSGGDMRPEFDVGPAQVPGGRFLTAAAGLDRPRTGDRLTTGGRDFVLMQNAERDARGLSWTMTVREAP